MKISTGAASALQLAVTEAIQDGEISRFGRMKFPADWEARTAEAIGDDAVKIIAKALDSASLEDFVKDSLQTIRLENDCSLPAKSQLIKEVKCFSDPLRSAGKVVSLLKTFPNQYRIMVRVCSELSSNLARNDVDLKLSDQVRIVSGAVAQEVIKLNHDNSKLDTSY